MKLPRRQLFSAMALSAIGTSAFSACGVAKRVPGSDIVFQGAYENHPGEPIDLAMHKWSELVEKRSNGSIKIDLFPSSQLGSKTDLIDQMLAGSPIITLADGAFFADQGVPDFGILYAPFLFSSWDDCWKVTESAWYKEQSDVLEGKGIKLLSSNWIYGDRHTLLRKPAASVTDLSGLKIRVPTNVIQVKTFQALGAAPTPMALGDVYTSLQQGTIDGLENPLPVLAKGKFQETAKYLALDGHVKGFCSWLTGTEIYNSLSEYQKNILIETSKEAGLYNNQEQMKAEETALEEMKAQGVQILDINIDEWKEKAQAFYSDVSMTKRWSPGLHEKVKEAMK